MAKYLIRASYVGEGMKGLLKEGGTKRRETTEQALNALGCTIEAYYFAFGDDDAIVIVDCPDNVTIAAASLTANASGLVQSKITVLLTPEEIDEATKKTVPYRPPGQ